ncbi:hypothetical protein ACTXT7_003806 [Hymenolepis weldensis]
MYLRNDSCKRSIIEDKLTRRVNSIERLAFGAVQVKSVTVSGGDPYSKVGVTHSRKIQKYLQNEVGIRIGNFK